MIESNQEENGNLHDIFSGKDTCQNGGFDKD